MLFKLFGPNAYGRYVLLPIILGGIIFSLVFWLVSRTPDLFSSSFERVMSGLMIGYIFGAIPSGYHILNRFGDRIYRWTHRKKSSTDRIVSAIYDSERSNSFDIISAVLLFIKVMFKSIVSLYIGWVCFPYIVFDLSREIHRTRLYYEVKKKIINKADRKTA